MQPGLHSFVGASSPCLDPFLRHAIQQTGKACPFSSSLALESLLELGGDAPAVDVSLAHVLHCSAFRIAPTSNISLSTTPPPSQSVPASPSLPCSRLCRRLPGRGQSPSPPRGSRPDCARSLTASRRFRSAVGTRSAVW